MVVTLINGFSSLVSVPVRHLDVPVLGATWASTTSVIRKIDCVCGATYLLGNIVDTWVQRDIDAVTIRNDHVPAIPLRVNVWVILCADMCQLLIGQLFV